MYLLVNRIGCTNIDIKKRQCIGHVFAQSASNLFACMFLKCGYPTLYAHGIHVMSSGIEYLNK